MRKPSFSIIDQCTWEVPYNEIIMPESEQEQMENKRMEIPVYCVYIEHPELGRILYDTGVNVLLEKREELRLVSFINFLTI